MIQQLPTFSTTIFLHIYYALYTYNEFIGGRSQLIEDCEEMIQALDNTSDLEAKRAALNQKAEDIIVLVINLIGQNSTETLDQDESTILTMMSTRGLLAKSRQWGLRLRKRTPRRNACMRS